MSSPILKSKPTLLDEQSVAKTAAPPAAPSSADEAVMSEISHLVNKLTGIQLGEKQRPMVSSRVKKRMATLGLSSTPEYAAYLKQNAESESAHLVSLLTTHHTYFFREFAHFEHLEKVTLPALVAEKRASGSKTISVWSAACSTGQEVYSLAMFIDHYLTTKAPDISYQILGTDVDPVSVQTAANGVFRGKEIQEVPLQFLSRHWAKGTGDISDFVKVRSTLKQRCHFEPMNLLSPPVISTSKKFDIIFCRNVFIYFNADQIKVITARLLNSLFETGTLFLGVSESLNGLGLPCESVGPSIYRPTRLQAKPKNERPPLVAQPPVDRPLRVLCVDDSPTILALLKKILTPDAGFEIVGTAGTGFEAAAKLKTLKVDIMTLDIHMPEQTGLEYLQTSFRKGHPPVVMLTSVSREDAALPLQCLQAGAKDYIEKPSLSTLTTRADEIRMKLKYVAKSGAAAAVDGTLVKSLARAETQIRDLDRKLQVVFAGIGDRDKIAALLKDGGEGPRPATVVVIDGLGSAAKAMVDALSLRGALRSKPKIASALDLARVEIGGVYISAATDFFASNAAAGRLLSTLVYGQVSAPLASRIVALKSAQLILEDSVSRAIDPSLKLAASEIIPATSFSYTSTAFFKRGRE